MALDTTTAAAWLADFADQVHENVALLTDLDRQIGDADHGSNMDRGLQAVRELPVAEFPDAAALLKKAGMTLVSTVGGASGPLYGTFFLRFATAAGEGASLADAFQAGLDGIVARGKAAEGDKTMVDALAPAVAALRTAGDDTAAGLAAAAQAAAAGRDATIPLVARKGRASYLGDRSAGHQDPGATSLTMMIEAAARTLG